MWLNGIKSLKKDNNYISAKIDLFFKHSDDEMVRFMQDVMKTTDHHMKTWQRKILRKVSFFLLMIHISAKSIVNFYDADPENIQSMLINCFKTEAIKYHPTVRHWCEFL